MISFKSIEIKDFCVIGSATIPLCNQGLVMIRGQNNDADSANSNGSGKTTIFKALTWCLYDQFVGEGRTTDVVRIGAKKAVVKVVFTDEKHEYEVIRERASGAKLTLFTNGESTTGRSISDTQATIEEKLGLDWDAFRNTVLYGQGDIKRFADPGTSDGDRKSVLKRVLRLDTFDKALELVKARVKQVKLLLEEAQVGRAGAERARNEAQTSLSGAEAESLKWKTAKFARSQLLSDEIRKLKDECTALQDSRVEIDFLRQKIESSLADISAIQDVKTERRAERDVAFIRRSSLTEERAVLEAQRAQHSETVNERRQHFQPIRSKLLIERDNLVKTLSEAEQHLSSVRKLVQEHTGMVELQRQKIGEKQKALDEFASLEVCPTCSSPLSNTEKHVAKSIEELTKLTNELRSLEVALSLQSMSEIGASGTADKLKSQLSEINRQLIEVESDIEAVSIMGYDFEQEDSSLIAANAGQAAATETVIREIDEHLIRLDQRIDDVNRDIAGIRSRIEALSDVSAALSVKEQQIVSVQLNLSNVESEENPYTNIIAQASARVEASKASIVKFAETERIHNRTLSLLLFWDRGFGNTGVPSMAMDAVMPMITESANEYMGILADGDIVLDVGTQKSMKSGATKDSIDIRAVIEGNPDVPPSGGQRCKINLAVDLALMDLVASREGAQVDVLLLDEILDGLDEEGRARVVNLLVHLRTIRSSVFVISHDSGIQEHFEQSLLVSKTNGVSTVTFE